MRYVPGHGFVEDLSFFKIPTLSKEVNLNNFRYSLCMLCCVLYNDVLLLIHKKQFVIDIGSPINYLLLQLFAIFEILHN